MAPLRIAQRGLVLVAVPLIFELVFVGVLAKMLLDARAQIWEERRARNVVTTLSILSRQTQTAARLLAAYTDSRDKKLVKQYDELVLLLPGEFEELRQLLKDRPEDLKALSALKDSVFGAIEVLEKCKGTFGKDDESRYAHLVYYPKLIKLGIKAEKLFDILLKRYRAEEMADREVNDRSSQAIAFWLASGVVLNIIIALSLAVSFNRSITSRLKILVDNTIRLAARKPLNNKVSGSDEISELDRVFHKMADVLADSERVKRDFVSMISHDLRTPLTAVRGTLELLGDGLYGELSQVGAKRVRTAATETDRLIGLINNLLDIEKMEANRMELDLEPLELSQVVETAIEAIRPLWEQRGITCNTDLLNTTVNADSDRLMQALVNLLSNAVKFSHEGSSIELSMRLTGKDVEVRVRDYGRGIPASMGDAVFERWKQTNKADGKSGKGSGIGLAITRSIIEAHDGTIGYFSTEGEGTTFWFRLPIADG